MIVGTSVEKSPELQEQVIPFLDHGIISLDRLLLLDDSALQALDFSTEDLLLRHDSDLLLLLRLLLLQPAHLFAHPLEEVEHDSEGEEDARGHEDSGEHDGPFVIPLQKPVYTTVCTQGKGGDAVMRHCSTPSEIFDP